MCDSRRSSVHVCVSDQHGGFELQAAEDLGRQNRLLEQLQRLRVSQTQSQTEPSSHTSFTPLLDVPVDSCSPSEPLKPLRSSPTIPNWLLTQNSHSDDELKLVPRPGSATSKRGRSPFRNGHSESRVNKKEKAERDVFFTVVETPRHRRPQLSQIFGPLRRSQSSAASSTGHSVEKQVLDQEYELKTVCISKTKRSLGEKICAVLS